MDVEGILFVKAMQKVASFLPMVPDNQSIYLTTKNNDHENDY